MITFAFCSVACLCPIRCVCVGSIFLFLSLFFSALVSEDLLCLLLVLLLLSETESVPATSVCVSVRLHSHPLGISG